MQGVSFLGLVDFRHDDAQELLRLIEILLVNRFKHALRAALDLVLGAAVLQVARGFLANPLLSRSGMWHVSSE